MRLALATLWVLVGSVLTATVYWGFLITPESTVWTLVAQAILALIALVTVPLGIALTGQIMKRSQGLFIAQWRRTGTLNAQVEEAFKLVDVVVQDRERPARPPVPDTVQKQHPPHQAHQQQDWSVLSSLWRGWWTDNVLELRQNELSVSSAKS